VVNWFLHHHATLPDQPIGQSASRASMEALLRQPLPEAGEDFAVLLAQFDQVVAGHACRINHPRFLAFIPGSPCVASTLGDWLCAAANFFAGVWLEAAGPAQVELVVLDWFRQWLNLPATTQGILTSGGSEANLTALVVAREQAPPEDRGGAILYVSEQRHWSIDRAARIMGLRPEQVRSIAVDADFHLAPASLADAISRDRAAGLHPWAVVANAGATNTGAVDPLDTLADLCSREGLWFHIDAAYGWSAVLTEEGRKTMHGIARADSITLDPHKWLAQTYEIGCLLIRDGKLLARTFGMSPDYMQDVAPQEDEVNFADRGLALTRRFRALKVWLSLRALGLGWFRDLVRHGCDLARLAEELLRRHEEFEVLSPRQLSILCYRFVPPLLARRAMPGSERERILDQFNLALIDAVRATGRAFLASTRLANRVALRFCFVNWRTTSADVEEVIALLRHVGSQLTNEFDAGHEVPVKKEDA
jgi:aromatic-L-amino-acid/L-tryptophan decarboxylase